MAPPRDDVHSRAVAATTSAKCWQCHLDGLFGNASLGYTKFEEQFEANYKSMFEHMFKLLVFRAFATMLASLSHRVMTRSVMRSYQTLSGTHKQKDNKMKRSLFVSGEATCVSPKVYLSMFS